VLDDKGKEAVRAGADRNGGRNENRLVVVEMYDDVDRLAGPEGAVGIVELRLGEDRAGCRIDLIVIKTHRALARLALFRPGYGADGNSPGLHRLLQLAQVALLQMELDVDRIVLGDRYDCRAGAHISADAEGDIAETAIIGRADFGVLEQNL